MQKHKNPSEKTIHAAVIEHWRAFGLPGTLVATLPNFGFDVPGLTRGLPDLLVIGGSVGISFIELKTKTGHLSADQFAVRTTIERAGTPVAVTYGLEEAIRALEDWGIVRSRRTRRLPGGVEVTVVGAR